MPKSYEFQDYDPLFRNPANRGGEALADESWTVRSNPAATPAYPEPDPAFVPQQQSSKTESKVQSRVRLVLKRGHTLTYAGLFLFTIALYFRPYELFTVLSWMDKVAYWLAIGTIIIFIPSQVALEGNLTARPRVVTLILLLTLAGLISIITAINPSEAWNEFNDVFIKAVLIFIVMINVVRTEKRLKLLIYVTVAVTFVLSFNAVRDYQTANFTVEGYRINGILGGMFGNPNDLALHFVTMTPIAVTMAFYSRNLIVKILLTITAILTVAGNVVTYSRGGFIGLLVVAVVLAYKLGRKKRLLLAIVGPIILGLFVLLAPGNYGVRLLSIFIPSLDPFGSAGSRQEILNRSIIVSLRHPISGIGMGNFHTVSLHETVTHNAFTQISAEMGFPALIIYLMFLTAPILWLRKVERATESPRSPFYYYLSIGLQASLIGYMISGFFAAVAYQWYAYYLVAYGVCLFRLYQSQPPAITPKPAVAQY
jgi:putative inorganic carbon (HCO3(-)) transporter